MGTGNGMVSSKCNDTGGSFCLIPLFRVRYYLCNNLKTHRRSEQRPFLYNTAKSQAKRAKGDSIDLAARVAAAVRERDKQRWREWSLWMEPSVTAQKP